MSYTETIYSDDENIEIDVTVTNSSDIEEWCGFDVRRDTSETQMDEFRLFGVPLRIDLIPDSILSREHRLKIQAGIDSLIERNV